mgnify:CR=1 FL=1
MSLRLAIVVGARPQFIKYAPIHQELAKTSIHQLLIHTGQHYDESMSGLMFEQLGLPSPDFNSTLLPNGANIDPFVEFELITAS